MADFSLSPGIVTREFDNSLTTVTVPQSSVGGVVGRYSWGPAMIPTMVASETELALEFGKPESDNYIEWFNGKNFLDYATSLNVVRMVDSANTKNATFSGTSVLVTNDESYNDSDEEELENQIKMRILNNRLTKYFITIGNSLPADIVNALKKYRDNNEYFKLCSD